MRCEQVRGRLVICLLVHGTIRRTPRPCGQSRVCLEINCFWLSLLSLFFADLKNSDGSGQSEDQISVRALILSRILFSLKRQINTRWKEDEQVCVA